MTARPGATGKAAAVLTVSRGIQVLRAFRAAREPLANVELVRRTGLPKATISRLTSTLLQLGYLTRPAGRREFSLGAAPLGIGHAFISSSHLLQAAGPMLQELADQLTVSTALAVRNELDMLYIAARSSPKVATLRLGVGSLVPMATTSIGHAFLWGLSLEERASLIERLRLIAGSKYDQVEKGLQHSFDDLKSTGTCAVRGIFQRDSYGVSLPVLVGRHRIAMALSCAKADLHTDFDTERKRISSVLRRFSVKFQNALEDLDGQP